MGTIVNVATVVVGALLGIVLGNRIPERTKETVTSVLGLFTLVIGGLSVVAMNSEALKGEVGSSAMIVVLAAGNAPILRGNPLEPVSTITVSIVSHGQLGLILPLLDQLDACSAHLIDKVVLTVSGNRLLSSAFGMPVVELHTVGRKSGERRTSPLTYMREDGRLLVVGSNFGSSKHPAWSWNLLANPEASVTIGGAEIPVVATQLTGAE